MIKKVILYSLGFAAILVAACTANKETNHDEHNHAAEASAKSEKWEEMDEFHIVMAESFHPYKDSMNLEPAKANAQQMATAAAKWANADLPEKVDNDDVKASLQKLKTDTEAFVTVSQSGNNDVIGESLNQLHDLFHEIQESWYSADEHNHHH